MIFYVLYLTAYYDNLNLLNTLELLSLLLFSPLFGTSTHDFTRHFKPKKAADGDRKGEKEWSK